MSRFIVLPHWCAWILCCVAVSGGSFLFGPQAFAQQAPENQQVVSEPTWTLNFKDSDIQEVIKFVAEATGKTLVIDPQVKGRVKVISAKQVNREELYNLFLSVLEIHGFAAVSVGDVVRVIPAKDVRTTPVPLLDDRVGGDIVGGKNSDIQVTQVIELQNITAVKVLPVIRPLVPAHAHLAAYAPSNAIIISDTRANIQRVRDLIARIDTAAVEKTELVPLSYASAEEMVRILTKLKSTELGKGSGDATLLFVADQRSNGVLISGDDLQRQRVKQLIQRLDQPQAQNGGVRVVYLEYARAEQVAKVLSRVVENMKKLSPERGGSGHAVGRATIEADKDTNSLLITADPESLQALLPVVQRLDIRRAQVLVEAIIVEMADISGRDLGIQWLYRNESNGFGSSIIGDGSGAVRSIADGIVDEGNDDDGESLIGALTSLAGQTIGVGRAGDNSDFLLLISALQQDTGANILSTPNLLTLDNHPAAISVGQNVPFVTGSYTSTGSGENPQNPFQTIERENVGIQLEVTPHVNEGDSVVLDIVQEVSSLSGATGINASDVITNERKISTRIMAKDGEVVVLGGLIKDDVQAFEQRVPVLGSIPWFGRLFRSTSKQINKTHLMVFIRATVIRDDEALTGATAEKYSYIRDKQINHRDLGPIIVDPQVTDSLLPEIPAVSQRTDEEGEEEADDEF
ncbi:type II secretion system secretin GspD [Maricurvus nonylphenolicus]|uniref:type II secretion system secretin GspD n=1 Tax=Maricurvus nonylphenolicus TaxID=1008307 RepID=UPI0036F24A05